MVPKVTTLHSIAEACLAYVAERIPPNGLLSGPDLVVPEGLGTGQKNTILQPDL